MLITQEARCTDNTGSGVQFPSASAAQVSVSSYLLSRQQQRHEAREEESAALPCSFHYLLRRSSKEMVRAAQSGFFLNSWHNQRSASVKRISLFYNEVKDKHKCTMEELSIVSIQTIVVPEQMNEIHDIKYKLH